MNLQDELKLIAYGFNNGLDAAIEVIEAGHADPDDKHQIIEAIQALKVDTQEGKE